MSKVPARFDLPDLPFAAWQESKTTLHLYSQIVGKVRLALHPKLNHWWHAALYLSPIGLTTGAMPTGAGLVALEFDLLSHALIVRGGLGWHKRIPLYDGLSVAAFYTQVMTSLRELGVTPKLLAKPFDPARVGSTVPFAEDEGHARYDAAMVTRFYTLLSWMYPVFVLFAGRFYGKSTPVHFFWHSFDLAYTRFSGKRAPVREDADLVTREAYSHEVISFGFWPGDRNVPAPAFYAYAAPEPGGLKDAPLAPAAAFWREANGSAMALLYYDALRKTADPEGALLAFFESAYRAGATRLGWNAAALEPRR